MTINPVQQNITNTQIVNYREQKGAIKTQQNVKPLKPQGHLVHDNLLSIPKFWYQDIKYDLKAIKDGFKGNTNDHQQGRLNDVGLKLGGIGIAAYLASKTSDPKLRLMEYLGLGSFLAAMSLYPVIAINAPSRMIQGFDIGKEYIDDQGRKKSVFQDSNYIPFDMYQGEYPGEDLDIIGDRMGIPRDIKNRHDLIKEQMRKIATQNNTLWMLTAGFATPVMAALTCVGLEKLVVPALEAARNRSANSKISRLMEITKDMPLDFAEIKSNSLSSSVAGVLKKYEGKELPQNEYDEIVKQLTENVETNVANGIKEDLSRLLKSKTRYKFNSEIINSVIRENITSSKKNELEKMFLVSPDELENIIHKVTTDEKGFTEEQLRGLKKELRKHFDSKGAGKHLYYKNLETIFINKIVESIKQKPSNFIDDSSIEKAVNFAKIIGDFKEKEKLADRAISIKFEESPVTMLAQSYQKFEDTLFNVLGIKFKEIKKMKESPQYAKEILESKLEALSKDDSKYEKAIKKLSKVMSDMDRKLNGENESNILNLINGTENVYNKTAERLYRLDKSLFTETTRALVQEEITEEGLKNKLVTKENLIKFLDGTLAANNDLEKYSIEYAKEQSKGVGSAKRNAISRIADRYQGVRNSFNRILLAMDNYRHDIPKGEYAAEVAQMARNYILESNSSEFTQKFKLNNNPELYRDVMYSMYRENELDKKTKDAFADKNLFERFQAYIKRVREVMGNNGIDFTKPHHSTGQVNVNDTYSQSVLSRRSKFDLVAQDPVTMVQKAAAKKYGSMLWLRRASIIGASVLGTAVLAQFAFGRIKNPNNIQKQVSDDK